MNRTFPPVRRPMRPRSSCSSRSSQQGVALIIALILLVVMTLFGLLGLRTIANEERLAGYVYDRSLAFQGAEAALRVAETGIEAVKPQPSSGCGDFSVAPHTVRVCAPPAPTDTPRWLDTAFTQWATATAVVSGSISLTPQYFIEYLGNNFPCSQNPDCGSQPCNCLRYRVTARAGEAGRAQVMLQSVYATDAP